MQLFKICDEEPGYLRWLRGRPPFQRTRVRASERQNSNIANIACNIDTSPCSEWSFNQMNNIADNIAIIALLCNNCTVQ